MKDGIFPKVADNTFRGNPISYWLLVLYAAKSFFAGSVHMFAPDGGAQSIGSVTLDKFTQAGSDTVIVMFALWGMEQLVIGFIVLVILLKYKSLISFAWGIYALEYLGRASIHFLRPELATSSTPPGVIADTILVPLAVVMFAFSVYSSHKIIVSNK